VCRFGGIEPFQHVESGNSMQIIPDLYFAALPCRDGVEHTNRMPPRARGPSPRAVLFRVDPQAVTHHRNASERDDPGVAAGVLMTAHCISLSPSKPIFRRELNHHAFVRNHRLTFHARFALFKHCGEHLSLNCRVFQQAASCDSLNHQKFVRSRFLTKVWFFMLSRLCAWGNGELSCCGLRGIAFIGSHDFQSIFAVLCPIKAGFRMGGRLENDDCRMPDGGQGGGEAGVDFVSLFPERISFL